MLRIRKILFPTDFSSYSNQAYLHAVAIAEAHKAALVLVYVNLPESGRGCGSACATCSSRFARPIRQLALSTCFSKATRPLRLLRFARDSGVDRIVMGTHGRTGTERLLMGSVAEKVLRTMPPAPSWWSSCRRAGRSPIDPTTRLVVNH